MSPTTSYRLSGVALLVGIVLAAIYSVLQAFLPDTNFQTLVSPISTISFYIGFIGSVLVALGLPGVYARQAERAGILGLLGFVFTWYVNLMQGIIIPFTAVTMVSQITAHLATPAALTTPPPSWAPFFILSMVGQAVAIPLLAIATLRAHVFPRWIGWTLLATFVVSLASMLPFVPEAVSHLPGLIASVAMVGYGLALLSPDRLARTPSVPISTEAAAHA